MEIEVKESVSLEDGKYTGVVTKVEYREEPYRYTDVTIKEDSTGFELTYGCPTNDSEKSKLMQLLAKFKDIKPGDKVDPEQILLTQKVSFMSIKEKKDGNEYTRVVSGSVKPLK